VSLAAVPVESYRHEAWLYAGEDQLVAGLTGFVRDGLAAGEPALVVLAAHKLDKLRESLGSEAAHVQFADMVEVGANPGRIISAWHEFVEGSGGPRLRGVGEPIWAARTGAELVECQRHEALLNLAFDPSRAWWLVCPYDTSTLDPAVIAEATRTHPWVDDGRVSAPSPTYVDPASSPHVAPLPAPPRTALRLPFAADSLGAVRSLAARCAARAGMGSAQVADLAMAVHEVAENSLVHGGGQGTLRVWQEGETVLCEVRDAGCIADPLAGRLHPGSGIEGARGLWLANALCDLVQLRTSVAGTTVRLHMRRRPIAG
jgi:anti-sigma regulatory factor (Ser/Thr protein kinase)